MKHTKGKWEYNERHNSVDCNGHTLAPDIIGNTEEETVANGKLIASAPELLEMVLRLKLLLEESVEEFNIPELNELIKKATE